MGKMIREEYIGNQKVISNLKYAVIGMGACGGVVAGRLLLAGCNVHLLALSDYQQLHDSGMAIKLLLPPGQSHEYHFNKLKVYHQASELPRRLLPHHG